MKARIDLGFCVLTATSTERGLEWQAEDRVGGEFTGDLLASIRNLYPPEWRPDEYTPSVPLSAVTLIADDFDAVAQPELIEEATLPEDAVP